MYNNGRLPRQSGCLEMVYGPDAPEVRPLADGFVSVFRKTSVYLNGTTETSLPFVGPLVVYYL